MSEIILSEDQIKARDAVVAHVRGESGQPLLTVGGYAGTGKTTVMAEAVRALGDEKREPLAFCAFSGKAVSVMRAKLERAGVLQEKDYCGTIHGLVYNLIGAWVKQSEKAKSNQVDAPRPGMRTPIKERLQMDLDFESAGNRGGYQAVFVDEGSMVGEDPFEEISNMGIPIVVFGDHGQLPPVKSSFNLLENPMIRLEKIHRQAEKSPIIQVSFLAREEGRIPIKDFGDGVRKVRAGSNLEWAQELTKDWVMLCGRNATRLFWNDRLRNQYGFKSHDLEVGERIICLKNSRDLGIFNGMMGTVRNVKPEGDHWYKLWADMDGGIDFADECLTHQFGSNSTLYEYPPANLGPSQVTNLFDWAWCITTHKSQGSEFENVCVMEERMGSDDLWRRWLYTAVTRSKKNLLVVGS